MHIVDGALSTPVLVGGGLLAAAGVARGLKGLEQEQLPQVGIFSAVFFVGSLVHVPIGPSSVHLILGGLVGMTLGWAAFPALLIALLLQAVFFGFGGLTVLGVNLFNIAMPAVLCHYVFGHWLQRERVGRDFLLGFAAGAGAIALTTFLVALSLALSGEEFLAAAKLTFAAHMPVMVVEGLITGAAVSMLLKVRPETLVKRLALVLVALLLFSAPAAAHKIVAAAYAEGAEIEGEIGMSNGEMAAEGTKVEVFGPDGAKLGETVTDADGLFAFTATQRIDHIFRANLGAGHVAEVTLPAAELPESLGGETPATQAKAAQTAPAPQMTVGDDRVAKAVAAQIRPLRKEIAEMRNETRMRDVLGGIGYILGLSGLAFFFMGRKKSQT